MKNEYFMKPTKEQRLFPNYHVTQQRSLNRGDGESKETREKCDI